MSMTRKRKPAPKLDFKKEYKAIFSPSAKTPEIVEVPDFKAIMIDGRGDPNTSPDFQAKVGVLYGLAYTLKFSLKRDKDDPFDFAVPPLSGLWCADDIRAFFEQGRRHEWRWTLLVLMPDRVSPALFEKARDELRRKKDPDHLAEAYFQVHHEGLAAQVMHIGPYAQEGPTIKKLHEYFLEKGFTFNGRHHEIYLSDPRRGAPEKMRTIIRQPVKRA
jgi:hypothetical protein